MAAVWLRLAVVGVGLILVSPKDAPPGGKTCFTIYKECAAPNLPRPLDVTLEKLHPTCEKYRDELLACMEPMVTNATGAEDEDGTRDNIIMECYAKLSKGYDKEQDRQQMGRLTRFYAILCNHFLRALEIDHDNDCYKRKQDKCIVNYNQTTCFEPCQDTIDSSSRTQQFKLASDDESPEGSSAPAPPLAHSLPALLLPPALSLLRHASF